MFLVICTCVPTFWTALSIIPFVMIEFACQLRLSPHPLSMPARHSTYYNYFTAQVQGNQAVCYEHHRFKEYITRSACVPVASFNQRIPSIPKGSQKAGARLKNSQSTTQNPIRCREATLYTLSFSPTGLSHTPGHCFVWLFSLSSFLAPISRMSSSSPEQELGTRWLIAFLRSGASVTNYFLRWLPGLNLVVVS